MKKNKIVAYLFLFWFTILLYELVDYRSSFGNGSNSFPIIDKIYSDFTLYVGTLLLLNGGLIIKNNYNKFKQSSVFLVLLFIIISYSFGGYIKHHGLGSTFELVYPIIGFIYFFWMMIHKIISSKKLIILICIISIIILYPYMNGILNIKLLSNNMDDSTNNVSYIYCSLAPFILCIKKNKYKVLFMILFALFVTISLKRTAFIALILSYTGYYLFSSTINIKKIIKIIIAIGLISSIGYTFIERIEPEMIQRLNKIEEDNGSGRLFIWEKLIDHLENRSFTEHLFGSGGYRSTIKITGFASAHNEFLEILIDFGLIYFFIYLSIHFKLIRLFLPFYKMKYTGPFVASYIIYLTICLTSHWLDFGFFIGLTSFWGYYLGYYTSNIKRKINIQTNENRNFHIQT